MSGNGGWSRGYEKESPTEPAEEPPDGHCPKCEHEEVDVSTISMTEGTAQRLVGMDASAFSVVSCTRCGYSEFYRGGGRRNPVRYFLVTDE
ncbi:MULTISPECIES: zinc ribbon domain-containing protein [Haloarcula]|uniref:zinc ribbon domain-containing protein n=1 Tax=Haloarcula TaxID=2237 RepID=UPI0023E767DF|nr:zinc ribbon domain-containing protein [Halomicroarcula sp. SHR3]